jgi:hypothetical protein
MHPIYQTRAIREYLPGVDRDFGTPFAGNLDGLQADSSDYPPELLSATTKWWTGHLCNGSRHLACGIAFSLCNDDLKGHNPYYFVWAGVWTSKERLNSGTFFLIDVLKESAVEQAVGHGIFDNAPAARVWVQPGRWSGNGKVTEMPIGPKVFESLIVLVLGLFGAASSGLAQTAALGDQLTSPSQLVQAASPPEGLPPAPAYLPGTSITPEAPTKDEDDAPAAASPPQPDLEQGAATAGDTGVHAEVTAAPSSNGQWNGEGKAEAWRKLRPYLPEPGHFAVIPGSELRPVLVRQGEFAFCDQIRCNHSGNVLSAWNGGAFDDRRGEFRVHGGGHADYGGNEIYVFDFSTLRWTRETNPQPLTGSFMRDTNGDETADACPAPAAGPPATHTYQGFLYLPKIDRYWLFGTVGYCSGAMGGSSTWEYDAGSKTWTALPELDRFASYARAMVDPESGNVIVRGGRRKTWVEIDPVTRRIVQSFAKDPFGSYIDGPAVFDSRRRVVYALVGGRNKDRLVAYDWPSTEKPAGLRGRLIVEWPKDAKKAWGMAQHASGLLVLWNGSTRIVVVNPDTGSSWEEETAGDRYVSMAGADRGGKVYSKWVYISELDAFFGITNPDLGVVLYRLGKSSAGTVQPISSPATVKQTSNADKIEDAPNVQPQVVLPAVGPLTTASNLIGSASGSNGQSVPTEIDAVASWDEICSTAILCDPMGKGNVIYRKHVTASGLPQKGDKWRSISQKFDHPQAVVPTFDPEVGGLRFTFPSNSGSGAAGNFKTDFSPDYSFQIGPAASGAPAQEAYIQFQVRYSCSFIWTDCDPQSSSYRKSRRCFATKRDDGSCTASKIALISTGDRVDFRADACTRIQIAINHGADHTLHGFHRCPQAFGFGKKLARVSGRAQSNSQPNGAYYCPRILDSGGARGWNYTADSCFKLIDDRWITIQIHLRFGPWQPKPKKSDPRLSHVSIWAAIEGENGDRQKLVIDNDFAPTTPEDPNDFIGKIWLMPHLYDKTTKEEHPPFYVWYRNLVISESLIPNPK